MQARPGVSSLMNAPRSCLSGPSSTDELLLDHSGVWRYRELILPAPEQYIVSRPEGNTSLYPVGIENCGTGRVGHRQIGLYAGLDRFFLKHEGENPTGSFKDRGMTVGVTDGQLLGATAVACASTGNTSASLASYAAQAGMQRIVFLPAGNVAGGKLAQSLAYGATTIQIDGDFDDAMRLVEQVCNELGIYLLNSLNPFRVEGQKAIGFRASAAARLAGPRLARAARWQPWQHLGHRQSFPSGVSALAHQPHAAHCLYSGGGSQSLLSQLHAGFAQREQVQADTVATAIKIGNPVSYTRARRVIEESDGVVEEVTDEEILTAKTIIDRAGIGCEPASAATLAGVRKLVARGVIKHDEHVVGILTGNLLKDTVTGMPQRGSDAVVEPTIDAIRRVLAL